MDLKVTNYFSEFIISGEKNLFSSLSKPNAALRMLFFLSVNT